MIARLWYHCKACVEHIQSFEPEKEYKVCSCGAVNQWEEVEVYPAGTEKSLQEGLQEIESVLRAC